MQPTEFVPDAADLAVLAFRLGWPGELPTAVPLDPKPGRRRAPSSLIRFIPLALRRKFIPVALRHNPFTAALRRNPITAALRRNPFAAALGRKFAGRRLPLHGWPVALSVPGPDDGRSWLPSVKLTGNPLD